MVKVGTAHYPDREPRPISDEDMARLMGARMWRSTRIMILLAALAGLRVSGLRGSVVRTSTWGRS